MGIFKKLAIFFGVLLVLFVGAAAIIPLVVDVDKYRPQIVEAVNDRVNGKFELGKLKLSLWGQIRIEVAGVSLSDSAGRPVLAVKDAYFHLPFSSVFSGAPELVFRMQNPTVNVVKDKSGKLNVMSLMKPSTVQPAAPGAPQAQASPAPSGAKTLNLPTIATRARLGVELQHADLSYKDDTTNLVTRVKDLNVVLQDMSLSHPTQIKVWADLDTKMGDTFVLRGPARIDGTATPVIVDNRFDHVKLVAKADMDGAEIIVPGKGPNADQPLFQKKKGMAANVDLAVTASETEAKIEKLDTKFFNAEVKSHGVITTKPGASPVVQFAMKSNSIELKPWVELVPMLKDYELGGSTQMEAEANGPSEKLTYKALLKVDALTAKAPKLKAQPRIDGTVKVITDQIENMVFTMKAPGNDLKIEGKLVSFTQPRIDMNVTSGGMDLDQLIEFPPPGAKPTPGAKPGATGEVKTAGSQTPTADYDAMLAPLRENKYAQNTTALVNVNMKSLKAYNVRMSDISGKMEFKDMAFALEQFGMKLFGGSIGATTRMDFKPTTPNYRFTAKVDGLVLEQAVESQFQLFKNTLLGKAYFDMSGEGSSFNPAPATQNLNAKGKFRVEKATFATLDVAKMASEAINKAIDRVAQKIPQVKDRKINTGDNRASQYDLISSDFTISGGKFTAPNFVAKAAAGQGIDLKGSTTVGLKDFDFKANIEVIDTYNLLKAKDLSVQQGPVTVPHLLAEGNGPVKFPVSAGCNLKAPCYSYTEVPEYLAGIALSNISKAATGKAKEEARKQAEELIKKAPPQVQDKLKDLKNKFFK